MTKVVIKSTIFLNHENDVIDGLQRCYRGAEAGSYGLSARRRESASTGAGARATPSGESESSSRSRV
jgi:hypothetical protein